ncbi:cytidine deaminase [Nocardia wallacei]|uniref:cytidine deaminase n=1 Tax=Nocardia wallacei TaxID=480035 RepID=UPI0024569A9D|nr:cytidine deaminase [Nocardia wallacei]
MTETAGLDAEDNKLLVLARGAMGRTGGGSGAAVRDTDGRTYAAGVVELKALPLTALQAAVAAAISSGAEGFEAAVVCGGLRHDAGIAAVHEVSPAARVILTDRKGMVTDTVSSASGEDRYGVENPIGDEGNTGHGRGAPAGFDIDTESEVFE